MTTPYYTGDNVPLKFTVSDKDGAVNPSTANVVILKPTNTITSEATAGIDGNAVSYKVPSSVTTEKGLYKAYFIMTLPNGERTHKIEFNVVINPERNK